MWLAWLLSSVVAQSGAVPPQLEVVTLTNGMRWVLLPRPDSRLVSGIVTVRAGGVHEREGATGVAHLLEHLAFKGTPMIGSGRGWRLEAPVQERALDLTHELAKELRQGRSRSNEAAWLETQLVPIDEEWRRRSDSRAFWALLASHDVQLNAWTSKDTTSYWGEFPQEQLHLWLAAEAQRFAAPVFRDFRTERDVVIQELRDRQTLLSGALDAMYRLAFEGSGYAWSTIGREADLRAMSPRSLDVFYERLYAPENAVGSLVGDFDPAQARTWLEETFAQIPAREVDLPARVAFTVPSATRVSAPENWVLLGFQTPSELDSEAPPHALLQYLLTAEGGVLDQVGRDSDGLIERGGLYAGPGLFERHLTVIALKLGSKKDSLAAQARFFKALSAWTPTEEELVRAQRSLERERLQIFRSRRALSEALATQLLLTDDWREVFVPRFRTATSASVVEVARSFRADKAWIVEVVAP